MTVYTMPSTSPSLDSSWSPFLMFCGCQLRFVLGSCCAHLWRLDRGNETQDYIGCSEQDEIKHRDAADKL